jgi:GAF domain-containing protein
MHSHRRHLWPERLAGERGPAAAVVGNAHDEERPGHDQHAEPADSVHTDLPSERSLFTELSALCETATRLAGVEGGAVAALMSSQSRELVYATNSVAERIDELQFAVGEGPCLDAYSSQWPQLCPRIDAPGPRHRWLTFSAGVQDLGVEAVFAFPMPGPQHSLGVLELYRRTAGALTDEQLNYAQLCAEVLGHAIVSTLPSARRRPRPP